MNNVINLQLTKRCGLSVFIYKLAIYAHKYIKLNKIIKTANAIRRSQTMKKYIYEYIYGIYALYMYKQPHAYIRVHHN